MKFDFTPIFHSRKAIEDAQIVIIPYNTLLHSSTREAIDIKLENSVVIIDEAHNVLETIGKNKIKKNFYYQFRIYKCHRKSYMYFIFIFNLLQLIFIVLK